MMAPPSWLGAVSLALLVTFATSQECAAGEQRNGDKVLVVDSFNDSGMVWKRLSMNESEPFWYNTVTGLSVWDDPREKAAFGDPFQSLPPMPKHTSPREFLVQSTLLVMAVMGMIFGSMGARWAYLYQHCPELLFPTKARKQRRRENNKMKQKRNRFKVSQDGKGGSSRNS